ncbi:PREDICTED: choline-phosphate cytidylyltransferase A [Rhagoletis zephyria]|uniref:choline-phosphate cytidylyltransferase A n=1 Tax=Rhagoletis zephyria TaxID=28612 RepID=UPI0008119E27|nr:PREDICTED: choline-phosphate cytidylyltransferase A [Rhagoletis zephyria]
MASSSVLANNPISTLASPVAVNSSSSPSSTTTTTSPTPISTRKRTYETAISMPAVATKARGATAAIAKASIANKMNVNGNDIALSDIYVDGVSTATNNAITNKDYTRTVSQCEPDEEASGSSSVYYDSPVKREYVPTPQPLPSISSGASDLATICKPAPLSTDEEAVVEREKCDYNYKITYQMARSGQTKRRVRVYADGIYDLFHQGHARQLMQAKNIFPNVYLIIVPDAPWTLSDEFIESNKIDFVAHDDIPYLGNGVEDIYAPLKAKGMFVATERTEGVSTSDIVARIVKDYDLYVRRNLARGYSAKDLNVSFLSEKKFRFQNKMDELKVRGRRELTKVKDDIITKWEEASRDFIDAFLLLFGRERLNHLWNESKGKLIQALSPPGSPSGSVNGDDEDVDDGDFEEDTDFATVRIPANIARSRALDSPTVRRSSGRGTTSNFAARAARLVEQEENDGDDDDEDGGEYEHRSD